MAAPDYITQGNFDQPAKGRMKFLIEKLGADALRAAWQVTFDAARERPPEPVPPVEVVEEADKREILRQIPPGGWSAGVRPGATSIGTRSAWSSAGWRPRTSTAR